MNRSFVSVAFVVCSLGLLAGVASAAQPDAGNPETIWVMISIFFGGMALNLTPCVYPLIPVTISFFGGRSAGTNPRRGEIVLNAFVYVLGIAVMYSMLGVFAALSGHILGSVLENPVTLVLVALFMSLFALSMFGVWEFRVPASITGAAARNFAGYLGSFFMGLTLGIVAAPCIGPFVASLLVLIAKRGDPVFGFWVFFSLSLGMGFPLFILASVSGRLSALPKSSDWMLWVRKVMGWIMLGEAAYLISPIMPGGAGVFMLLSAVAAAAGVHLGWIDRTGLELKTFRLIKKTVGVACFCLAVAIAWHPSPTEGVEWTDYSAKALSEAKASGKPVIVDFYASWCSACRRLDRITFHEPSIREAAKDFIMIRVDLSNKGDLDKESLVRVYGVHGIPTVIFLKPGGDERTDLRLIDVAPPDRFLTRMNDLRDRTGSLGMQ